MRMKVGGESPTPGWGDCSFVLLLLGKLKNEKRVSAGEEENFSTLSGLLKV